MHAFTTTLPVKLHGIELGEVYHDAYPYLLYVQYTVYALQCT